MLMRPRDWFSVGVRLIGVWVFYRGFEYVLTFGASWLSFSRNAAMGRPLGAPPALGDLQFLFTAGYFGLAIYLVFGADHLTRWAFREKKRTAEADRLAALAATEAQQADKTRVQQ